MNELIKNLRRGFAFLGSAPAPRFEPLGRTHFLDARRRSAQSRDKVVPSVLSKIRNTGGDSNSIRTMR